MLNFFGCILIYSLYLPMFPVQFPFCFGSYCRLKHLQSLPCHHEWRHIWRQGRPPPSRRDRPWPQCSPCDCHRHRHRPLCQWWQWHRQGDPKIGGNQEAMSESVHWSRNLWSAEATIKTGTQHFIFSKTRNLQVRWDDQSQLRFPLPLQRKVTKLCKITSFKFIEIFYRHILP